MESEFILRNRLTNKYLVFEKVVEISEKEIN